MKRAFQTIFLILSSSVLYGQSLNPDILYLIDKQVVKAKVVEVSDSLVIFKKYENVNGPVYTIKHSNLIRIEYSNGYIEHYTSSANSNPVKKNRTKGNVFKKNKADVSIKQKEQSSDDVTLTTQYPLKINTDADSQQQDTVSIDGVKGKYYYKFSLSLAADLNYMLTGIFEEEETFDFGRGNGGLVRMQYNVIDNFGIRFSTGYNRWNKENSISSAQAVESILKIVPVTVGAKYYFGQNFFMVGDIGIIMHKTTYRHYYNESKDKTWQEMASGFKTAPSVSLSIGSEIRLKKIIMDLAPFLQWYGTDEFELGRYYAGVRIGAGIGLGKMYLREL